MKVRYIVMFALLLAVASVASAANRTWEGWITDSHCGLSGAHPGDTACARSCVKKGAKFVLVDDSTKKVYLLAPQDKVEPHAGEHVVITGTVEGHTLHFTEIDPAR